MRKFRSALITAAVATLAFVAGVSISQDSKDAAAMQMPESMKPQAAHAELKKLVGTWDVEVEMSMAPGMPPEKSKATETCRMFGELWLVAEFQGTMMGQPFTGTNFIGYNPYTKQYEGVWVDTMSPTLSLHKGPHVPGAKATETALESWDPMSGQKSMSKIKEEWTSDDTRTAIFVWAMPDGSQFEGMKMSYTRRK